MTMKKGRGGSGEILPNNPPLYAREKGTTAKEIRPDDSGGERSGRVRTTRLPYDRVEREKNWKKEKIKLAMVRQPRVEGRSRQRKKIITTAIKRVLGEIATSRKASGPCRKKDGRGPVERGGCQKQEKSREQNNTYSGEKIGNACGANRKGGK